jgi:hypothetical protein
MSASGCVGMGPSALLCLGAYNAVNKGNNKITELRPVTWRFNFDHIRFFITCFILKILRTVIALRTFYPTNFEPYLICYYKARTL